MSTKSVHTKQFIIETVAPLFNKYGYAATGLSDITRATGLTKGALYGNFINKEDMALEAFNYNMKVLLKAISKKINKYDSPVKKLFVLTDFFREYKGFMSEYGGCPILNVGVDSKNQNPLLHERVKFSINKIISDISLIIKEAILLKEIKEGINPDFYSKQIFTLIEGSVFMMTITENEDYILDMIDFIDKLIQKELLI